MVYNTTLTMPALLIYPDGIIFLLTKEHSSVFPFQWVWRNEFSVLIYLKLFLFHLQFWHYSFTGYKILSCQLFSFGALKILFSYPLISIFFFSCLYYCSSFENTMMFFSGSCQDFYCLQFSLLFIMIWCAIVLIFFKKNPYYNMLFNLRLNFPIPHCQMFLVLHSCSFSRTAAVNSYSF